MLAKRQKLLDLWDSHSCKVLTSIQWSEVHSSFTLQGIIQGVVAVPVHLVVRPGSCAPQGGADTSSPARRTPIACDNERPGCMVSEPQAWNMVQLVRFDLCIVSHQNVRTPLYESHE